MAESNTEHQSPSEEAHAKLSLVIPVYNEAEHLAEFLRAIDSVQFSIPKELIFINDCSTDGSASILADYRFVSDARVITQERNQGKGAAIRRGFAEATGTIVGVQDADFEYSVDDIHKLIEPIVSGKADVVFGSRFSRSGTQVHRTFHYIVNRVLTMVSNLFSGLYLSDMETCYKFFRADVIKNINLESNRFGFEPEVTAKIARLKLRVQELPISYFPRNYIEGKKITWRDGVAALRHIVYFNVNRSKNDYGDKLPTRYIPKGKQWL